MALLEADVEDVQTLVSELTCEKPQTWEAKQKEEQAKDSNDDNENTTAEADVDPIYNDIARGNEFAEQHPEAFKLLLDKDMWRAVSFVLAERQLYLGAGGSE